MITEYNGKLNLEKKIMTASCKHLQCYKIIITIIICVLSVNFIYQDSRDCLDAMGLGSITMDLTGRENKHPHPEWSHFQVIQWKKQEYARL